MLPITRATVEQFCRCCLQELRANEDAHEPEHSMQRNPHLHKWFGASTGLVLSQSLLSEVYSHRLCHDCYTKTRILYDFRDKAICVSFAIKELIIENQLDNESLGKLKSFCTTCLKKLKSLSPTERTYDLMQDDTLYEWLSNCTGVCIKSESAKCIESNYFPTHVCNRCYKKLRIFVEYRRIARESQEYLDSVLGSSEDNANLNLIIPKKEEFCTSAEIVPIEEDINYATGDAEEQEEDPLNHINYNKDKTPSLLSLTTDDWDSTQSNSSSEDEVDPLQHNNNKETIDLDESFLIKSEDSDFSNDSRSQSDEEFATTYSLINGDDLLEREDHTLSELTNRSQIPKRQAHAANADTQPRNEQKMKTIHCEQCNKQFRKKFMYEAHVRGEHEGDLNPYLCEACPCSFRCYSYMRRHFIETHNNDMNEEMATKPVSVVKTKSKWSCTVCKMSFGSKGVLSDHVAKVHSDIRPHRCDYCLKTFKRKDHLNDHIKAVHHGIRLFKCSHCEKTFAARKTLRVHEMGHTGERPFSCEYCQKTFRQISDLKIHIERHTTDPSLLCPICYRAKSSTEELQAHIEQHNSNGFQCTKCGKTFKKLSHLNEHDKAVHLLLRPYKCSYCKLTFGAGKTLRNHELIHTDKWPVSCPICQKGFRAKTNLRKHMRTHKSNKGERTKQKKPISGHIVNGADFLPVLN